MIKKMIRAFLLLPIFLFFVILVCFQIKAENYITEVDDAYQFFNERPRLSYEPFLWFYLKSKLWAKEENNIYWASIQFPYQEKGLLGRDYLIFNIEYNAYAMKCYYEKDYLFNHVDIYKVVLPNSD